MPHYANFQLRDHSEELSNVKIYHGAVTAVSIAGYLTELGQMRTVVEGITIGTVSQEMWVGDVTVLSSAIPADGFAQRETKWLVRYHDNVTLKKYSLEVPTADLDLPMLPGTDFADLTVNPMLAFVTRFNSFARCPDSDVNAVTLDSVQHVGRNL